MDYFERNIRGTTYLIKPHIEVDNLFFTAEVGIYKCFLGCSGRFKIYSTVYASISLALI